MDERTWKPRTSEKETPTARDDADKDNNHSNSGEKRKLQQQKKRGISACKWPFLSGGKEGGKDQLSSDAVEAALP